MRAEAHALDVTRHGVTESHMKCILARGGIAAAAAVPQSRSGRGGRGETVGPERRAALSVAAQDGQAARCLLCACALPGDASACSKEGDKFPDYRLSAGAGR